MKLSKSAVVLLLSCLLVVASCAAAQGQAEGASIFAGCKAALGLARAQGQAGDLAAISKGCEASLRVWDRAAGGALGVDVGEANGEGGSK